MAQKMVLLIIIMITMLIIITIMMLIIIMIMMLIIMVKMFWNNVSCILVLFTNVLIIIFKRGYFIFVD